MYSVMSACKYSTPLVHVLYNILMHIASWLLRYKSYIHNVNIMSSYIAIAMHSYVTLDLKAKVASYIAGYL